METATCNEGSCPTWSDWSDWSECSEDCDGGIQSQTRECQNGEEGDCAGSATREQQCNLQSCSRSMVYWDNRYAQPEKGMIEIKNERLPIGQKCQEESCGYFKDRETAMNRCIEHCLAHPGCIATYVFRWEYIQSSIKPEYRCFIAPEGPFISEHIWSKPSMSVSYTMQMAVFKDYYEANPYFLTWNISGTIGASHGEVPGVCDQIDTEFGLVKYKGTEGIGYTAPAENMFRETGSADCAARCFETAGCSFFFVENDSCNFIIGSASGGETNENVSDSGMLNGICPSKAFRNTYKRQVSVFCYIWAPNEGESFIDDIVGRYTDGKTPLNAWTFTTKNNPFVTSANKISIETPDMEGTDKRLRPIVFKVETLVRMPSARIQTNRKRRSAEKESEFIFVDELTLQEGQKYYKQKAKEAKQAAKQRSMMPRTEDILAEIEAIEQQATNFILGGGLTFPDGVEVAATGPVELIEFVQTAADGSIAADCSSGTCECTNGFVDNGNGCEIIVPEVPTTTQAPATPAPTTQSTTTRAPTTTKPPASNWIPSLDAKMEAIFQNGFQRQRPKLLGQWKKQSKKFGDRHKNLARECYFVGTYEDDSVDFNSVNTCRVSFKDFAPFSRRNEVSL